MTSMCVYCNESNDFNGEHIFSAGLGGDDRAYMLTDCVCRSCNSLFSALEAELLRKSPAGIARLGMQESGRGKGKRAEPPKLQTADTYIFDEENGFILEAELQPKFEAKLAPQIILNLPAINLVAESDDSLTPFIDKLRLIFSEEAILAVQKIATSGGATFKVSRIEKRDKYFVVENVIEASVPPNNAIWLVIPEGSFSGDQDGNDYTLHPRFYLHNGKTINYKSQDMDSLTQHLVAVSNFLYLHPQMPEHESKQIDQPRAKVGISFDFHKSERALAKIGFNFLIKIMGADYARDEAFANIKSSILKGEPQLPASKMPGDELNLFIGTPPHDHHVLFLHALPIRDGRAMITFMIKLYGGEPSFFVLSYDAPAPNWGLPIYFLINYQQHKINKIDSMVYIRNYCGALMQLSPLASSPMTAPE
ncbi:hypothetical protein [Pseudomonas mediterranea]|uniref:hypothetical protein n=1 Tax=Pseudomonas mediterranea TaxID=183795 RepID=UPI000AC951E9|nr:hypothetical protein [Pseudomonas mediterranea]